MVTTRRTTDNREPEEEQNPVAPRPRASCVVPPEELRLAIQDVLATMADRFQLPPPHAPAANVPFGTRRPSPIEEVLLPVGSTNQGGASTEADSQGSHAGGDRRDDRKGKAPMEILEEGLPPRFKTVPVGEYNGSTDPEDHLSRFENASLLHQYPDGVKCRVFLNTLAGSAQRWFNHLPPASIHSFEEFKEIFLHQFSSAKKYQKSPLTLFSMKQKPKETLREYLHRFSKEVWDRPSTPSDILTSALTQGLQDGDFFRSLVKKPPSSYPKLLERANKYIHLEETQLARRGDTGPTPPAERKPAPAPPRREARREAPPRPLPPPPPRREERAVQAVDTLPIPREYRPPASQEWRSTGSSWRGSKLWLPHNPEEDACQGTLVGEPTKHDEGPQDALAQILGQNPGPIDDHPLEVTEARHMKTKGRERTPLPEPAREDRPDPREGQNNVPHRGTITMIAGGSTDGDSNRARKAHGRRLEAYSIGSSSAQAHGPSIQFGPRDLEGVSLPHDDALVIRATIANYDVARIFIDTGSSVNVLYKDAFNRMQIDRDQLQPMTTSLFGFSGHEVRPLGQIQLPLSLGEEPLRRTRSILFTVVDAPSSYNVILGRPALSSFEAVVSTFHQKIKFPVQGQVGVVSGDQGMARNCYIDMVQTDLRAAKRKPAAEVQAVQEAEPTRPLPAKVSIPIVPEHPDRVTHIAADLPEELKEKLVDCLTQNSDIFAWSTAEITGVSPDIMEHRLNTLPDAKPVRQKRRHFSPEQDRIIREEVNKLRHAGQIREVQFPTWLANIVLVPKPGGKWRVCVDFRDLNKACPKDCYPLPRIDQLVDSTSGYELICMMDAYQGYHQIPLAPEDQEKVSFVTSDGTFCYTVMPFGLKNVGATYQRLMDRVFEQQRGRNVEVYVDDILIKSEKVAQLTDDISKTFNTLRQYGLKLNPNKCLFGVKGGCFLGYIVTERGIEANPEKVRALKDMASPRNTREVQRLVGRITALSRFISHSATRSLPFFKVLRRATRFSWDEKCEQAFTELKQYLNRVTRVSQAFGT
ncbi:uncharacterized protein LOC141827208 [Curcuma longa]|uniref:uncharacterized protein LOC141827208 n=1 Tax=Curcuma longa TaxID=136217 RepID=UPI003D9DE558